MNFFAGRRINSRVLQRNASIFFSFLKKPTPQNTSFSKIFIQQTVCKICFNTLRKLSLIFRQKFFKKDVFIFYSFIKKSTLRKHIFFLKKKHHFFKKVHSSGFKVTTSKKIYYINKFFHFKYLLSGVATYYITSPSNNFSFIIRNSTPSTHLALATSFPT